MSSEATLQSQACFLKAAHDFLEAQAVSRENEDRIEKVFIEVIEKGHEYRTRNKQLTEENQLLKRAMRKFYSIGVDERKKNEKMQVEMEALRRRDGSMQRKLASIQKKYQQLHQKMSAVIREVDEDENSGDEGNEIIENSQKT